MHSSTTLKTVASNFVLTKTEIAEEKAVLPRLTSCLRVKNEQDSDKISLTELYLSRLAAFCTSHQNSTHL